MKLSQSIIELYEHEKEMYDLASALISKIEPVHYAYDGLEKMQARHGKSLYMMIKTTPQLLDYKPDEN